MHEVHVCHHNQVTRVSARPRGACLWVGRPANGGGCCRRTRSYVIQAANNRDRARWVKAIEQALASPILVPGTA